MGNSACFTKINENCFWVLIKNEEIVAMKIINILFTCSIVLLTLNSCGSSDTEMPIVNLLKQNSIATTGIAFDTAKQITLDTLTGGEIEPCGTTDDIFVSNSGDKQPKEGVTSKKNDPKKCNTKIVNADNLLKDAIKSSETPIKGIIRVNGEDKEARFVVTVTALYQGSHCATTYAAGTQRTSCINKEIQCAAIRKATKNPNYPC
ncbi:MAG: hypothetical protein Q7U30_05385 [Methylicorpusculum sp.]|nr:hypothetical protein [Methylicorpusculum sp.]